MKEVNINIGMILFNVILFFILGTLTQFIIKINIAKIISKLTYIIIILVMWWIVISSPTETSEQVVEGITKLTYFFINVIVPFIIGEMLGDSIGGIFSSNRAYRC